MSSTEAFDVDGPGLANDLADCGVDAAFLGDVKQERLDGHVQLVCRVEQLEAFFQRTHAREDIMTHLGQMQGRGAADSRVGAGDNGHGHCGLLNGRC